MKKSWRQPEDIGKDKGQILHRQKLFVDYYMESFNGCLAARKAGYSEKHSGRAAWRLRAAPAVKAEIEKRLAERESASKDRAVIAMDHAYSSATVDIMDLLDADGAPLPVAQMPPEARRAIHSLEIEFEDVAGDDGTVKRRPKLAKIKLHDKTRAQELFAKYAGRLAAVPVQIEAGKSFADLVLQAQRERERDALPAIPEAANDE